MARSKRAIRQKKTPSRQVPRTERISTAAIDWSSTLRPINVEHIERLAGAAHLPAIQVWEFQPRRYRGIDGYHRWRLAKHRGETAVEAVVHHFPPGADGEKAFEFDCVRSNLQHGLPLTRDERDRAIARLWRRWGRAEERPGGPTLEEIGRLFNLTKQRVHQILLATQHAEADGRRAAPAERRADVPRRREGVMRTGVPSHFSTFGRFSAATRRLTNILDDRDFMNALLRERRTDAIKQLQELRGLIDKTVGPSPLA